MSRTTKVLRSRIASLSAVAARVNPWAVVLVLAVAGFTAAVLGLQGAGPMSYLQGPDHSAAPPPSPPGPVEQPGDGPARTTTTTGYYLQRRSYSPGECVTW